MKRFFLVPLPAVLVSLLLVASSLTASGFGSPGCCTGSASGVSRSIPVQGHHGCCCDNKNKACTPDLSSPCGNETAALPVVLSQNTVGQFFYLLSTVTADPGPFPGKRDGAIQTGPPAGPVTVVYLLNLNFLC